MENDLTCVRCQSPMIEGFATTEMGHRLSRWFEGKPVLGWAGFAKAKISDAKPARWFRCPKCGYTEMNVER